MSLFRLSYFSMVMDGPSAADLEEIIAISVRNNEAVGITGMLVFRDGFFAQLLEGPRAEVCATYNRVARDARHCEVTVVEAGPVDRRLFPTCWMALAGPAALDDRQLLQYGHSACFEPATLSASAFSVFFRDLARRDFALVG
jgi:hypothetical protein